MMRKTTLLLALFLGGVGEGLPAQESTVGTVSGHAELPEWMARWSPTGRVGDLPWGIPGWSFRDGSSFLYPRPKTGLFWTGGNPAGLRSQDNGRWNSAAIGMRSAAGDYRKPLDPAEFRTVWINGVGWRPVGDRASAIGRITVSSTDNERPNPGGVLLPYASNPLLVMDTTGSATGALAVGLDGAMAWDVGGGAVGLALGYRASQRSTDAARVSLRHRAATPGVVFGGALPLGDRRWWLGLHGLWQRTTEAVEMVAISGRSVVYLLNGFGDPPPIQIDGLFRRKLQRDLSGGVSTFSGQVGSVGLDLAVGTHWFEDKQWPIGTDANPPVDRWKGNGLSIRIGAHSATESRLWWRIGAEGEGLSGTATREAVAGTAFEAEESKILVAAEGQTGLGPGWDLALTGYVQRETRRRVDFKADAVVDLTALAGGISGEVVRKASGRFHIAFGVFLGSYRPDGSIPDASSLGPVYRSYVAPGVSLSSSSARMFGGSVTARYHTGADSQVWVRVKNASVRASGDPLWLTPEGSRQGWFVEFGMGGGGE